MATLVIYPDGHPESSSVDGYVGRSDFTNDWAAIRNGAGNMVDDADNVGYLIWIQGQWNTDPEEWVWTYLQRGILLFDTSALGAGSTVTAAVLSIYVEAKYDNAYPAPAWEPDAQIYTSTPGGATPHDTYLEAADYQQIGTVPQCDTARSFASITAPGYNDWALNATGRSNIPVDGVSRFALRNVQYDVANSAPAEYHIEGTYMAGFLCHLAEYGGAGTTSDPKATITYTPGAPVLADFVG